MALQVRLKRNAQRQFRKLDAGDQRRIGACIDSLAENPRPRDSEQVTGERGALRVRVGGWRIVYEIDANEPIVWITRIASRGQAYGPRRR